MLIIPAIDLKEGKCVRLEQGLMDKATVYSDDPGTTAKHWEAQGAELLHVVDLNGAFAGVPKNLDAIKAIRAAVRMPIEVGGGIRDIATIQALVSIGIDRIILGTAAIENPAFVQEACVKFPGRIIVGIDAKEGLVAIKGWAEVTTVKAVELAVKMQSYGVIAIIYTDIKRDGMLSGPNIEATQALAKALHIPVIASGGVHTMKDIENLLAVRHSGVSGVITGKAIYSGSLNLREAILFVKMNDNRCVR
ncbi:MAG: 1-(5-phosphoribosyl)-5-[(5-phosphoribosylamino)methylideneamino]imidazole-4-carboxamide isomerase [Nitrospirae bacterium GWD2_57_9]|nr:MAG: 1-(5-phosphoribosyl)-5-[(5-phosphoribosylamino)methylideneamino]imidazole-4-carboxamide isomerase [Nitrospirae bacterium GWD2_57_9]